MEGINSTIDILNTPKQGRVYNFLKGCIFDDIKYPSNVKNFLSLIFNSNTGNIITKKNNTTIENLEKHCVFTNFFIGRILINC